MEKSNYSISPCCKAFVSLQGGTGKTKTTISCDKCGKTFYEEKNENKKN